MTSRADSRRHAEARLNDALASAQLGTWELDLATHEVLLSGELPAIMGLPAGRVRLSAEEWRRAVPEPLAIPPGDAPFEVELRVCPLDGAPQRWLNAWATRVVERPGDAGSLIGYARDITPRRRAEQALRDSETREALLLMDRERTESKLRRVAEDLARQQRRTDAVASAAQDQICTFAPDGRVLYANRAMLELWQRPLDEAYGRSLEELDYPPDVASRLAQQIERVLATGEAIRDETTPLRFGSVHATFEYILTPIVGGDGAVEAVAAIARDTTERRRSESRLQASEARYRALSERLEQRVEERTAQVRDLGRRLTMAEQGERRRISQILHDDLQQVLYGIDTKLWMIGESLRRTAAERAAAERAAGDIQLTREWIGRAITTTRQLTVDLSPLILSKEGLVDALQWLRRQMQELHGLRVSVRAAHAFYIRDEDLRVLLFQIVRELLFNVKQHAGVDQAAVELSERDGSLQLVVADQGRGFEPLGVEPHRDAHTVFGLYSARERLRLIGGDLTIDSEPGRGTRVLVQAPLPDA